MTAVVEPTGAAEPGDETQAPSNVLKAKALHTALSDALLFTTAPSERLPMLEAVRMEFGAGQLLAVATDRFTVGASRVDYDGETFAMMLAGADAKSLVKMAKTAKRDERIRDVYVNVTEDRARRRLVVTFRFSTGEAMTVRSADVELPRWRHIIASDESRMGSVVGSCVNPAHLAKFAKVRPDQAGPGARLLLFPTVNKEGGPGPTTVRVGDDFIGAIMPVRPPGGRWVYDRPEWLDAADETDGVG